jgi:ABC-type polar amino acid transport system ATPase subunit
LNPGTLKSLAADESVRHGAESAPDDVPVVRLEGVHKRFGELPVLKGIDLSVKGGEVLVVIGPSGSGKSTLLRCVNLLEPVQEGRIYFEGRDITHAKGGDVSRVRTRIGMVFQQFNLFPHLTALDNIVLPLRSARRLGRDEAELKAAEALRRVGLLQRAAHYPGQLSGGQQQRVAIARALAMDPQVMLFDEPTSALDPELVGEVLRTMREVAETGMTMVVVTHEIGFAREIGDLNVFMEDGLIVEQGPRSLFDNPTSVRAREFIKAVR